MAEMCAVKIMNCVPWSLVLSIALSSKSTVKLTMVASILATNATRTRSPMAPWLETPTRRHTGDSAGPGASASLLPSWGRATVRFWPATFTASDDNSLQCVRTAEATTRRHSIFFFAVRHTHRHVPLPTTSTPLILDTCGLFWSRSGPWHAPWPGMRERGDKSTFYLILLIYLLITWLV